MKNIKIFMGLLLLNVLFCCTQKSANTEIDYFSTTERIRLNSYIHDSTDCGEWGGHYEHILFYKNEKGESIISYRRDTANCFLYLNGKKALPTSIKTSYTGIMNKTKQRLVNKYIEDLIVFDPPHNATSNASNRYEVEFGNTRKSSCYKIDDHKHSWQKYDSLRNMLIENQISE